MAGLLALGLEGAPVLTVGAKTLTPCPPPIGFPQDIAENGCAPTMEEQLPRAAPSPLGEAKDPKLREDRRPITVHFGQVCTLPSGWSGFVWFCFLAEAIAHAAGGFFISVLFGETSPWSLHIFECFFGANIY